MPMEQIPINGGEPFDNVVHLPGGQELDDEPDAEADAEAEDEPGTDTGAATAVEPAIGSLLGEGARIVVVLPERREDRGGRHGPANHLPVGAVEPDAEMGDRAVLLQRRPPHIDVE